MHEQRIRKLIFIFVYTKHVSLINIGVCFKVFAPLVLSTGDQVIATGLHFETFATKFLLILMTLYNFFFTISISLSGYDLCNYDNFFTFAIPCVSRSCRAEFSFHLQLHSLEFSDPIFLPFQFYYSCL